MKQIPLTFRILIFLIPLVWITCWDPHVSLNHYEYLIHHFYSQHIQYGRDFVGTYGPLGWIGLPFYHPDTFARMIVLSLSIYLFLIWRILLVGREALGKWFEVAVASALILTSSVFIATHSPVLVLSYFICGMFVVELCFFESRTLNKYHTMIYGMLFALFLLMKFTNVPLILYCLTCSIFHPSLKQSRNLTCLIAFTFCTPVLWMMSHQQLDHLFHYFRFGFEVVSGYKYAMQTYDGSYLLYLPVFLISETLVIMSALIAGVRFGALKSLTMAGFHALLAFIYVNHGYVRVDYWHNIPMWTLSLSTLFLFGSIYVSIIHNPWARRFVFAMVLASGCLKLYGTSHSLKEQKISDVLWSEMARQARGLSSLLQNGTDPLNNRYQAVTNESLQGHAFDMKGESADPQIGDPSRLAGMNGRLVSRPTLASFIGYTPTLTRLNHDFLLGDNAPKYMIWQAPFAILGLYPTSEDPLGWLATFMNYSFHDAADGRILLIRNQDVTLPHLGQVMSDSITLDSEWIYLSSVQPAKLWIKVQVNTTILAKGRSALFRVPSLCLDIMLQDDTARSHRLNLKTSREGFLLSPYFNTASDFERVLTHDVNYFGHLVKAFKFKNCGQSDYSNSDFSSIDIALYRSNL
jgi:hypothetical protein